MHTVIERELELKLLLAPERSVPVPARFRYLSSDPYAVHVIFHLDSDRPVHWTFARELLLEGVFRPCGRADVRIWPAKSDGRSVICLALSSPSGSALLQAPTCPVALWVERTLRLVPPGAEPDQLGLDEQLGELLASARPVEEEPPDAS